MKRTAIFLGLMLLMARGVYADGRSAEDLGRELVADVKGRLPGPKDLRGREDVVGVVKGMVEKLSVDEKRNVLLALLNIGMSNMERWCDSPAVVAYWVEVATTAEENDVREQAISLLREYVPAPYLVVHAAALLKAFEAGKMDSVLVLGKCGSEEARRCLSKVLTTSESEGEAVRAALAKLGDAKASAWFVEAFVKEKEPEKKGQLARRLGYIGDASCVMALAREMRSPAKYVRGAMLTSLRVDILAGLSEVYPREAVFSNLNVAGDEKVEAMYGGAEKWLSEHLGVTWTEKRPEPLFMQSIAW